MISRVIQADLQPVSPDQPMGTNWKILSAIFVVGGCSAFAKLASAGKEVAVAYWFGRSSALDALLVALLLPTSVANLLAGSFATVLIPSFIRVQKSKGPDDVQRFFSSVQTAGLVLLMLVSIVLGVAAPRCLAHLGLGFSAAKLLLCQRLVYVFLPCVVLNGLTLIWSSVLNAGETFALPAITPVVTPLMTLGSLFVWGRRIGIFAVAAGTVAGGLLEAICIGRAIQSRGLRLKPLWGGWTPELRLVTWQFLPMLTGSLLMGIYPIIDQFMAAMLTAGSVAALSYGNKIVMVVTTLTSSALSTAILPYLSQMVTEKDWRGCRRTLKVYSILALSVTIPITAFLVVTSRPLVRLLYQRGAFTQNDALIVSAVLIGLSLVIPFSTWSMLFVRYLSALHRNDILAYGAIMNVCLNVVLNLVLMRKMGVVGIALSTSLVCIFSWVFTGFYALRSLGRMHEASALA